MLTKIWVDGFRSLNDFTFEPKKGLNVLVGANGAGKTNIIDFLKFIGLLLDYDLNTAFQKIGGSAKNFSRFLNVNDRIIRFKLWGEENNAKCEYTGTIALNDNRELIFTDNFLSGHYNDSARKLINDLDNYALFNYQFAFYNELLNKDHSSNLPYFVSDKSYNFNPSQIKKFDDFSADNIMKEDGESFVKALNWMQNYKPANRKYGLNLFEKFKSKASFISNSFLNIYTEIDYIRDEHECYVKYKFGNKEVNIPLTHVSDGTAKWFALCLAVEVNDWLNLEEPENFLHPELQRVFINMLRERMEETGGIAIISTHSETILNNVKPEEVVMVTLEDGKTKANRVNDPEHLNNVIRETGFGMGYFYVSGDLE